MPALDASWKGNRRSFDTVNTKVVLQYPDYRRFLTWVTYPVTKGTLKVLIKYLEKKKFKYEILPEVTYNELKKILRDKEIENLILFGHGDTKGFCLGTNKEFIDYDNFRNSNFPKKKIIHQFHCGNSEEDHSY